MDTEVQTKDTLDEQREAENSLAAVLSGAKIDKAPDEATDLPKNGQQPKEEKDKPDESDKKAKADEDGSKNSEKAKDDKTGKEASELTEEQIQSRIEEIEGKDEPTEEDIAFMKEQGYEVEGEADDKEKDGEKEPKTVDLSGISETIAELTGEEFKGESLDDVKVSLSKVGERITSLESTLDEEINANKVFVDLFQKDAQYLALTKEFQKVGDFKEAVYKVLGQNADKAPNRKVDPDGYAAWKVAQERIKDEQKQAQKEAEAKEKRIQANIKEAEALKSKFQRENKLSDQDMNSIMSKAGEFVQNLIEGKVTPEFLQAMSNHLNFETATANAKKQGEKEAKKQNAITFKKRKQGDGLPSPRSSGGKASNKAKNPVISTLQNMAEKPLGSGWG